jgi:hypothetical protein
MVACIAADSSGSDGALLLATRWWLPLQQHV